jgi:hypothetical protein
MLGSEPRKLKAAARLWAESIEERFAKVGTYEIYQRIASVLLGGKP